MGRQGKPRKRKALSAGPSFSAQSLAHEQDLLKISHSNNVKNINLSIFCNKSAVNISEYQHKILNNSQISCLLFTCVISIFLSEQLTITFG